MKTKHTPGPWHFTEEQRSILYGMFRGESGRDEARANVTVAEAAPTLLEAAENLENDNGAIPEHAWNMLQAAIKKARGEA